MLNRGSLGLKHFAQCPVVGASLLPQTARGITDASTTRKLSTPGTRSVRTVLFHSSFPVDMRHNAKIGRPELARWAERRLRGRRQAAA